MRLGFLLAGIAALALAGAGRASAQQMLTDTQGLALKGVGPYYGADCNRQLDIVATYCGVGKGIAPLPENTFVEFIKRRPYLLTMPGSPGAEMTEQTPAPCAEGASRCVGK